MTEVHGDSGIIVGVDGSRGSKVAVQWAARDAELRNVPMTLVHVLPPVDGEQPEFVRRLLDDAARIARKSCRYGPVRIDCEMPRGRVVSTMARMSKSAELVVVGCLGTGTLRGRHLGSVSAGLIHDAHCPVVVLHDDVQLDAQAAQKRVVVGIDGSPESEAAIGIA
ncbi:universal stress protein, partial [Mycobacterium asiaticum]